MPKVPKIKGLGALPSKPIDEVTKGVLDKLPQVNRRELIRGALSTLVDTSALGKVADVVVPAVKAGSKLNPVKYFDDLWGYLSDLKSFKKLKKQIIEDIHISDWKNPRLKDLDDADWDDFLKLNLDEYSMGINDLDMDKLLTGEMSWNAINKDSGQILKVGKELHDQGVSNERILKMLNDNLLLGGLEYSSKNAKSLNNILQRMDSGEIGKPNLDWDAINIKAREKGYFESDGKYVKGDNTYDSYDDYLDLHSD